MRMMRRLIIAFLLCQLCAHSVISADEKGNDTTIEPDDNKTPIPSTATVLPVPEIVTEPSVVTDKPNITTQAPLTTTTTPKPKPAPAKFPDNIGKWSVVDAITNVTCIILNGALQISIPHTVDNITTTWTKVDVPVEAEARGECGALSQKITLIWTTNSMDTSPSNLTFQFALNRTNYLLKASPNPIAFNNYGLTSVMGSVQYSYNNTPAIENFSIQDLNTFQVPINNSYKCISHDTLNKNHGVELELARLKLEAFRIVSDQKFSAAVECSADGYVADIVPIAVGASLVGLVAIVLVAYLIGRRRSRARGYQSV